jgi:glutamate-1-semialdehyde 2,1-aminomutase
MSELLTNRTPYNYPDQQSKSAELYRLACEVMPGGNTRTTVYMSPYPLYAERGAGCYIYDADGCERIDFINNYTSTIHGHCHSEIIAAVRTQLELGTCFALPTEAEIRLATLLCERIESAETIRFANSGTEAVMMAIKAARAFTLRPKIAKAEGAYHGSYDYVEVSEDSGPQNWGDLEPNKVPYCAGTPAGAIDDVVVFPFNNVTLAETILRRHAKELAAILIDPLPPRAGLSPARPEFLAMLRRVADETGIVLISDEVISFRVGYHGAQGEFGFRADLTALGKIVGGGFPVGAVAGRRDIMSVFDPSEGKPRLPHGGTFNANPITMVAGLKAMQLMTPEAFACINKLGNYARDRLGSLFRDQNVSASVSGYGSLLRIHPSREAIADYRSAYQKPQQRVWMAELNRFLLNHGIFIGPTGLIAISTPMKIAHIDDLVNVVREAIPTLG